MWVNYNPLIKKACEFAQKAHGNQKRENGESYFSHVEITAETVAGWGLDDAAVAAAFLHDVVEDTDVTKEDIEKEFGEEVSFLVNGVTKLKRFKYQSIKAEVENMRKFILAVSKDIRVVLIKLADRLHNMRTIAALPPEKQHRVALETMEIYAQLAFQLGMFNIGGELEDMSFPILHPKENAWLNIKIKDRYQEREQYAQKFKLIIENELNTHGIRFIRIDSRGKRRTSVYRKLLKYDMNLDRIYDLVAIRCILKNIEDCYAALGVIHGRWVPMPNRIKDYIALPKPNGYQSLHTTIFGPEKKIIEMQIRTQDMHERAELGIAAHWAYQQNKNTKHYHEGEASFAKENEMVLISQLRNWQRGPINPKEFMQFFKIDLLEEKIMAMTPKGKIINLPREATPVDFAYQIHSEIGNNCVGAMVNGKIAPLDTQLQSGDLVEILTQKNKQASEDWLNFVKTNYARGHIKNSLRRKSNKLRPLMQKTEFRIIAQDKIGVLKNIASVISRSHLNITDHESHSSNSKDPFKIIKISIAEADKNKIEKVMAKLKKIEEIKSVECRPAR